MANYNVGNIEIGVISNSKSALNSLDKTITKLQELSKIESTLKSINVDTFKKSLMSLGNVVLPNYDNYTKSINDLKTALETISKVDVETLIPQINSIIKATDGMRNTIIFPNFALATESLNKFLKSINKLNKVNNLDFTKLSQGFKQLADTIEPFLNRLEKSQTSLEAISNTLNKLSSRAITKANNELKKTDEQATKVKSKLGNLFDIGKIYFLINYSERIITSLGKFITYASDYAEILNKFQVSFGNLYQDNLKLINQLAEAFGFSTNTLLDYTATFNNMLQSLGNLSDKTNATISQTLTRMAIDYSSLFNVSLQRAMEAFQSALSGNIRTLRSISGFDVSEITIFSIYQELGGTRSMRQLNQLEKRLLRIIAIQRQMQETGALGDYGRTINCGFDKKLSNENRAKSVKVLLKGKYRDNFINYDKVIKYCRA